MDWRKRKAARKLAQEYDLEVQFFDDTNAFTLQTYSDYSVGLYPNILADVSQASEGGINWYIGAISEEDLTIDSLRDIIKEIRGVLNA